MKTDALRPSEMMYRMIFERASEGILVLGSDFGITHANPMIGQMLECDPENLIGRKLEEFIHPEDVPRFREQQERRRQGQAAFYECRYITQRSGGIRFMMVSASPLFNEEGAFVGSFGFITDATARRLLELEKDALQIRTQNAARMASLGEMAGGISHEINNPLAVISGIADQQIRLLEEGELEREELVRKFEKIRAMCDRIAKIINGLQSIARDGEGDPFSIVTVNDILVDVLDFCGSRFKNHGIDLRLPVGGFSTAIECRRVQISQVLLNLLNNSFDAVSGSPSPWVTIEGRRFDRSGADWIELSVTDSGEGIPIDLAKKIMDPFFTTKGVGKGTGLGLSISDAIVKSHQGRLYLDPQATNTRFVMELPIRQSGRG